MKAIDRSKILQWAFGIVCLFAYLTPYIFENRTVKHAFQYTLAPIVIVLFVLLLLDRGKKGKTIQWKKVLIYLIITGVLVFALMKFVFPKLVS